MSSASLLISWESASRTRETWNSLGLLLPWADGLDLEALADLSVGERDARLLALRRRLFGQPIEALAYCPGCGSTIELAFQVSDIETKHQEQGPCTVQHGAWSVDFRLPDSRDLKAAGAFASVEEARRCLIDRCVIRLSKESEMLTAGDAPPELITLMEQRMVEADPQADVRLKLNCPACATAWDADVDIGAFVATEVAAGARRLLRDVHRLASAYGWREDEILSLGALRRQAYLDLVGTE